MAERPYVWQMIKEAITTLGSRATNAQLRTFILQKYPGVNPNTVNAQVVALTVNNPSRIHFPENHKPRKSTGYLDILFRVGRGEIALYDPAIHGKWEIAQGANGKLVVRQIGNPETIPLPSDPEPNVSDEERSYTFALESHLRDFIASNLGTIENGLSLYVDEQGVDGVEYQTPVGLIDVLGRSAKGDWVVIELKLARSADQTLGQLLRYIGWVNKRLANGSTVRGFIVANEIDAKLKYAVSTVPNVGLLEYTLQFKVRPVSLDD